MQDELSDVPPKRYRFRFSLLALLIFITLICVGLAWLVQPQKVTVTALFLVESAPVSGFDNAVRPSVDDYEILKKSQLAVLKSNYVLTSALRNPGIGSLPVFNGQTDPVTWLQDHLEVEFPQDSEILSISLTGNVDSAADLVRIVDAVAKAYKDEVIHESRQQKLATRDLFARNLENLNRQIKRRMEEYSAIARESGKPEGKSLRVLQELDMKRLDRLETELTRLESDASTEGDSADAKARNERIKLLRDKQAAIEQQLVSRVAEEPDVEILRHKIAIQQRIADDLTVKLERLDMDASAPDRIRQLQAAVPSRN
jgi:hypothetical protein